MASSKNSKDCQTWSFGESLHGRQGQQYPWNRNNTMDHQGWKADDRSALNMECVLADIPNTTQRKKNHANYHSIVFRTEAWNAWDQRYMAYGHGKNSSCACANTIHELHSYCILTERAHRAPVSCCKRNTTRPWALQRVASSQPGECWCVCFKHACHPSTRQSLRQNIRRPGKHFRPVVELISPIGRHARLVAL